MLTSDYRERCRAVVDDAKARLTLADVWDLAPFAAGAPLPRRDGHCASPLRDGGSKTSFSISEGGRVWCDFARDAKGGIWEFVQECMPNAEPKEIARLLVERAGLEWPKWERPAQEVQSPRMLKEKRLQAKARREEAKERIYREREKALAIPPPVTLPDLPECLHEVYLSGNAWALANSEGPQMLSERRGWPIEWVEGLLHGELLSWPVLPWRKTTRAPAMAVLDRDGRRIGWHQCLKYATDGKPVKVDWMFLPYIPSKPPRTDLERMLANAKQRIPPLPFWIGDRAAKLVAIVEGQWDAIALWGALGGFYDGESASPPILIMGVRGAESGPESLLAHWGRLLRGRKIWVIRDADSAGELWVRPKWINRCQPRPVSFVDRLREASGLPVVVSALRSADGGKDFDDFYRARRPTSEQMWGWVAKLGLLEGETS